MKTSNLDIVATDVVSDEYSFVFLTLNQHQQKSDFVTDLFVLKIDRYLHNMEN